MENQFLMGHVLYNGILSPWVMRCTTCCTALYPSWVMGICHHCICQGGLQPTIIGCLQMMLLLSKACWSWARAGYTRCNQLQSVATHEGGSVLLQGCN